MTGTATQCTSQATSQLLTNNNSQCACGNTQFVVWNGAFFCVKDCLQNSNFCSSTADAQMSKCLSDRAYLRNGSFCDLCPEDKACNGSTLFEDAAVCGLGQKWNSFRNSCLDCAAGMFCDGKF